MTTETDTSDGKQVLHAPDCQLQSEQPMKGIPSGSALSPYNWLSQKLQVAQSSAKDGLGVFAREPVSEGERLIVWGGKVLCAAELAALPAALRRFSIQVEEDAFLVSTEHIDLGDYVNHSCEPNAGLSGPRTLVALRAITPGEEICFDYAMSDANPFTEFSCNCGTPNCRGAIGRDDWRRRDLQARYRGRFSPWLARRIERFEEEANFMPNSLRKEECESS